MKAIHIVFIEIVLITVAFFSIGFQQRSFNITRWKQEPFEDFLFAIIIGNFLLFLMMYTNFSWGKK